MLSFLPETVHCGTPLGDHSHFLSPSCSMILRPRTRIRAKEGLSQEIFDLIHRICQELPADSELSRLAIRTDLKMILMMLVSHYSETGRLRGVFDRQREAMHRLAPIFEYLQQHYDEPLGWTMPLAYAQ